MEAASRPPLEAPADLPVEEPLDPAKRAERGVASAAPSAAATAAAESNDPDPTDLNFVDPEMFLKPGQAATAVPVVNAAEQSAKAPDPPLELVLEDPVVDNMLSAPPPPVAPLVASPAPATATPKPPPAPSPEAASRRWSRFSP